MQRLWPLPMTLTMPRAAVTAAYRTNMPSTCVWEPSNGWTINLVCSLNNLSKWDWALCHTIPFGLKKMFVPVHNGTNSMCAYIAHRNHLRNSHKDQHSPSSRFAQMHTRAILKFAHQSNYAIVSVAHSDDGFAAIMRIIQHTIILHFKYGKRLLLNLGIGNWALWKLLFINLVPLKHQNNQKKIPNLSLKKNVLVPLIPVFFFVFVET